MKEWPESRVVADQLNEVVKGKTIEKVTMGSSPHKFFFTNKQAPFLPELLQGRTFGAATPLGIYLEISAGENALLLGEGMNLRYIEEGASKPQKHQLLIEMDDGSALAGSIQMYGGAWAYAAGSFDNPYYRVAKEKPFPHSEAFDKQWFAGLFQGVKPSASAKAFLATEQRIPGLGNGVLQDILLLSGVHPKRKVASLSGAERERLFLTVKKTLQEMYAAGGRDVEKDLFGKAGGYRTLLSAKTWKEPCPLCGETVEKQNYLGGSIYFCPACQPLPSQ